MKSGYVFTLAVLHRQMNSPMNLFQPNAALFAKVTMFKHCYFILLSTCTLSKLQNWEVIVSSSEG
jgi:hypothetical protein